MSILTLNDFRKATDKLPGSTTVQAHNADYPGMENIVNVLHNPEEKSITLLTEWKEK